MQTWQLQEAKARLSQLVKQAKTEGPQMISVHGEPAVVVLSRTEFEKLSGSQANFIDFMKRSPLKGLDIDIARDRSLPRDTDDL